MASFRKNHAMWTKLGMKVDWLSPEEVGKRLPYVNLEGVQGATLHSRDGFGDPSDITNGYAKRAREMGVVIENGVEVTGFGRDASNRRVVSVQTSQGEIVAGAVIVCTGAWTRKLGAMVGVDVPIEPMRRQIIVTDKFDEIADPFPMTVDLSTTLYFHRESGGILIGMSDHTESPGFDTSFNEEFGEKMLLTAMERAPVLANASPKHKWAGLYEVTPDHHPVIDRLAPLENVYCCAGFSGHGLMHAPAAGLLSAELLLDGKTTTLDITPLALGRFADLSSLRGEANVI
jgi:sarcosine oxidase subunit beta